MAVENETLDDQGTTPEQARKALTGLLENGFNNELGLLAMVLGRTEDELRNFIDGNEEIDADLLMKIRGIAEERNIAIDS